MDLHDTILTDNTKQMNRATVNRMKFINKYIKNGHTKNKTN